MPYRYAWAFVLALFPLIGLAFWPNYFGKFDAAPLAFHVHGATAGLWLALLAWQAWSVHNGRSEAHRTTGLGVFVLLPTFVGGGLLVLQSMSQKYVGADPFYALFGHRLGAIDTVAVIGVPLMVFLALKHRADARLHGGFMLGTAFFLLSPILGRLGPLLPPFAITGPETLYRFAWSVQAANTVALLIPLLLAWRDRRTAAPMLTTAAFMLAAIVGFEVSAASPTWIETFKAVGALPALPLFAGGTVAALLAIVAGWFAGGATPARAQAA